MEWTHVAKTLLTSFLRILVVILVALESKLIALAVIVLDITVSSEVLESKTVMVVVTLSPASVQVHAFQYLAIMAVTVSMFMAVVAYLAQRFAGVGFDILVMIPVVLISKSVFGADVVLEVASL